MRHIAPSADTTTSAASSSLCSRTNASRCRLPISSSPSNRNFTLTGRRPAGREECVGDRDRNQHRSLVVGHAAGVEAAVANGRRPRRAVPLLERIGRLHVVVTVDQDRRLARRAQPLAVDDRMAAGGKRPHGQRSGRRELGRHPARRPIDVRGVRGIGADARDRRELDELGRRSRLVCARRCAAHRRRRSFSTVDRQITWPVIQPAYSEAKNSTP